MLEQHLQDRVKHTKVVKSAWIGAGIVGHEEEKEDQDEVLRAEGEPVNASPGCILC